MKKVSFDFDFATLAIKGRKAMGNILTRHAVRNITKKGDGVSTLEAREIWFDPTIKRLNVNKRLMGHDLNNHFDDDLIEIRKYQSRDIVTILYREGTTGSYYLKRFQADPSDKKLSFLDEGDSLVLYSMDTFPHLQVNYDESSGKKILVEEINVDEFIAVKGYKAKGKRVTTSEVKEFVWLASDPEPEPDPESDDVVDVDDEINEREAFAEGTQTELFPTD